MQTLVATNEGLAVVAGIAAGICGLLGYVVGWVVNDRQWTRRLEKARFLEPYYREFGDADLG